VLTVLYFPDKKWLTITMTSRLEPIAAPQIAELPEIKLFGRWSCDDVQVSDMSLQVGLLFFYWNNLENDEPMLFF
jgi:hypothetical protein